MPKSRPSPPSRRGPPAGGRPITPDPKALFDDSVDNSRESLAATPLDALRSIGDGAESQTSTERLGPRGARLVVTRGAFTGRVLTLGAGTTVIGRSSKCELPLKGSSGVSRRHCQVQLVGARYAVVDLASRNGTLVNGERVARRFLDHGDLIDVGDERVRFEFEGAPGSDLGDDEGIGDESFDVSEQPTMMFGASGAPPAVRSPPLEASSARLPSAAKPGPNGGGRGYDQPATAAARPPRTPPPPAGPPVRSPHNPLVPLDNSGSTNVPKRTSPADVAASLAAREELRAAAAARRAATVARRVPAAQASAAAAAPAPRPTFGLVYALALVAAVVVGGVAYAGWHILDSRRPARVSAPDVSAPRPAATAPVKPAPATATPASAQAANEPPAARPAPAVAVLLPEVAAKSAPASDAPTSIDVKATAAGRVESVSIKLGDVVKKGQALVVLEPPAVLARKLAALQDEERAFIQAAKDGSAAARRDLERVQKERADLERRARAPVITTTASGKVVEVLVRAGSEVKIGDTILRLRP